MVTMSLTMHVARFSRWRRVQSDRQFRRPQHADPNVGSILSVMAVGAVLVGTSGCGGNGVHPQTAASRPAATPVATTATPTASTDPTPRQRAASAAVTQIRRYELLIDDLTLHRKLSLDRLYTVATQPDVTDEIAFLNHFRSANDRQVGRVDVTSMRVQKVSLGNRPGARPRRMPTVEITACLDVSHVRAFGPTGRSIVPKSRKPYYLTRLRLVNVKYPDPKSWLVSKISAIEERSCSA
jgi:hypothetical protein